MSAHGTSVAGACSSTARLLQSGSQAEKCLSSSSCGTFAVLFMWRDGVPMPQVVKGTLDATVPQILEELQERVSERMHEQVVDASVPMTVHQPSDEARRVPADLLHRQSCRYACGDAVTGPSDSDGFEDCESPDQPGDQASRDPADPVHRQSCRHACGDAATGPSSSDFVEDSGNPDQPGDQACRVPTDSMHRQGCCRSACGDAVKGPSNSGRC